MVRLYKKLIYKFYEHSRSDFHSFDCWRVELARGRFVWLGFGNALWRTNRTHFPGNLCTCWCLGNIRNFRSQGHLRILRARTINVKFVYLRVKQKPRLSRETGFSVDKKDDLRHTGEKILY